VPWTADWERAKHCAKPGSGTGLISFLFGIAKAIRYDSSGRRFHEVNRGGLDRHKAAGDEEKGNLHVSKRNSQFWRRNQKAIRAKLSFLDNVVIVCQPHACIATPRSNYSNLNATFDYRYVNRAKSNRRVRPSQLSCGHHTDCCCNRHRRAAPGS